MRKNVMRVTTRNVRDRDGTGRVVCLVDVYGEPGEGLGARVARLLGPDHRLAEVVEGVTYRHVPYQKKVRPRHEAAVPPPAAPEAKVDVPRLPIRRPRTSFLSLAEERRAAADRLLRAGKLID